MNDEPRSEGGLPEKGPPAADADEEQTAEQETEALDAPEAEPTAEPDAGDRPRRVLRSDDDRVLAGVAGGLGAYFGVDSIIFRIGFALSIFFGGLGVVAYLLLAIFVPSEGDPNLAAGARIRGGGFWRGVGLVVLALVAIGGLFCLAGAAAFAVAIGWGVPVAIVAIAAGALLVLAAFRGGARWLIPPAVAIALGASVAAASGVDFSGGMGDRGYRPLTEASIPVEGYRLGVGDLVIDLRELDWSEAEVVELKTSMGAGRTAIYVPERVCVTGETHVGGGDSIVAGERNEGLDVNQAIGVGSTATPRLELDSELDFGEIRVINSDTAAVNDVRDLRFHGPFDDEQGAELRAAEARACAVE